MHLSRPLLTIRTRHGIMNGAELARLMDTWSDALNVAEVVASPFLRVTADWDLRDWQTMELPDGIHFERLGDKGDVTEAVVVVSGSDNGRRILDPGIVGGPVPTWLVIVAAPYSSSLTASVRV